MSKITATVDWHVWVHCPECDGAIDLADLDEDDWSDVGHALFNNQWDDIKKIDLKCCDCECVFNATQVQY